MRHAIFKVSCNQQYFHVEMSDGTEFVSDKPVEGQAERKTVLAVFQNHRLRPVTFISGKTPEEERENLLEAVLKTFHDVLETGEGTSTTSGYYLQMESKEWEGRNIDVTGFVQQRDVIHLCVTSSTGRAASAEVSLF